MAITMQLKDYYKTLEIPAVATPLQIKKSFRQLALRHHPDKNPGNAVAEAKFKEIQEAYEVLSDPDKREEYNYKRWYTRSLNKQFTRAPDTAAAILAECTRLYNYMISADTTRVDYDGLSYHIRRLLSDTNILILQQAPDTTMSATVIERILTSANPLPLNYIEPIAVLLLRLAGPNEQPVEKIQAFVRLHERQNKWRKYRVPIVLAITLLLCWLIYIISRS